MASATKTTVAERIAERVEIPQVDGRIQPKVRLGGVAASAIARAPMMVDSRRLPTVAPACRLRIDIAAIHEVWRGFTERGLKAARSNRWAQCRHIELVPRIFSGFSATPVHPWRVFVCSRPPDATQPAALRVAAVGLSICRFVRNAGMADADC
jgi:hypothetical protein